MVCQWGMSNLGPLTFGERDDLIFLGRELTAHKNYSEKTAEMIDEEVKKIIQRNYERAEKIIGDHKTQLEAIVKLLLEREVLSSDEINAVLGKTAAPPSPDGVPFKNDPKPRVVPTEMPGPDLAVPEPARAREVK